tara:strand:+ start:41 stop:181 length:141 start_codon:yes stop_codon:yes gene_type:complete
MDNEMITKTATSLQLERIADALEEILRLVKLDQEANEARKKQNDNE